MSEIYFSSRWKVVFPLGKHSSYDILINNVNIICCAFVTMHNDIFIITHGFRNGDILYYNEILDILTDPNFAEYRKFIHCCYPGNVAERYPELEDYLILKVKTTTSSISPVEIYEKELERWYGYFALKNGE